MFEAIHATEGPCYSVASLARLLSLSFLYLASAKIKILAKNISRIALVSEEATKYLSKQLDLVRAHLKVYILILI